MKKTWIRGKWAAFEYAAVFGCAAALSGCAEVEGEELVDSAAQELSASDVFGFENLAHWTVSSGTKQAVTPGSQGNQALGVSNTYYTQITSAAVSQLGAITAELALDVKLPVAATWGDVRVIVRAPSQGIWYGDLGGVALATLGSGSFRTARFTVPQAIRTALAAQPTDATFEIIINGHAGSAPIALDHLRFTTSTTASVVEVRAPHADDIVYLLVNGVRHRVAHWQAEQSSFIDVSSWFVGGNNDVRLLVVNAIGGQGVDFEMRVDGVTVADVQCDGAGCGPILDTTTYLDREITLPPLNLPAARTVTVTSPTPGKIYLNDDFTGLTTPATLSLPAGQHRIGLGVSNDVPGQYSGAFYEESVTVGASNVSVTVGDEPALGHQYASRIAVVPVRTARVATTGAEAVLDDAWVPKFAAHFRATSDDWVEPFSYGLNRWDITVLPMEEELEVISPDYEAFQGSACQLLENPKYAALLDTYDTVVFQLSNQLPNGDFIGNGNATMGGRCGQIPKHWIDGQPDGEPLSVILHEMLHSYETHEQTTLYSAIGVEGVHGAEERGYQFTGPQGEPAWTEWQRYFVRGQVPELASMRPGDLIPQPVSAPDYHVGVFRSMRHGLWLAQ